MRLDDGSVQAVVWPKGTRHVEAALGVPGQETPILDGTAFSGTGGEVSAESLDGRNNACGVSDAKVIQLRKITLDGCWAMRSAAVPDGPGWVVIWPAGKDGWNDAGDVSDEQPVQLWEVGTVGS